MRKPAEKIVEDTFGQWMILGKTMGNFDRFSQHFGINVANIDICEIENGLPIGLLFEFL